MVRAKSQFAALTAARARTLTTRAGNAPGALTLVAEAEAYCRFRGEPKVSADKQNTETVSSPNASDLTDDHGGPFDNVNNRAGTSTREGLKRKPKGPYSPRTGRADHPAK